MRSKSSEGSQESGVAKIRVAEPLIIMVVFSLLMVYLLNTLNTGNWFWFRNDSELGQPSSIVIVDHGHRVTLKPGHVDFAALSGAALQSLRRLNNTDLVGIGLSEQTISDYATKSLVIEINFEKPVHFNSLARTGEPTQLLIPIDGPHDGGHVFRGARGVWWYGALRMADPAPIYQALQGLGYPVMAPQPIS